MEQRIRDTVDMDEIVPADGEAYAHIADLAASPVVMLVAPGADAVRICTCQGLPASFDCTATKSPTAWKS